MSMSCCCDAVNPYVCPKLGSPWFNQCNSVEQMVWKATFWACEISGADCVPGAGSCTYDHEDVVLVYDGAGGLYAPKNGSVTATLETQTVAGQVQWRIDVLNLPGATYENDGSGNLVKTGGGDCCYTFGVDVIETRRIWDSATAATQNFDCSVVGLVDSDCTDCNCYNTAVTTDARAFYNLFGGYYFLGLFSIRYRPAGCIVPGIDERSYGQFDISIGQPTLVDSDHCIDCGTLEYTACQAYGGSGGWSVGRKDSVTFDGTLYHECNHGGPIISYYIKCSSLHPVSDPITASEFCKVECDNGEGGGCICDSATLVMDEA